MDMDQAAVFLAGSLLTMTGLIVIVVGAVVINNILHKYWKPLGWFQSWAPMFDHSSARFVEPQEVDKSIDSKLK
jgi:sugar phosphate permease